MRLPRLHKQEKLLLHERLPSTHESLVVDPSSHIYLLCF